MYRAQDTTLKRDVTLKVRPTVYYDRFGIGRCGYNGKPRCWRSQDHPNIAPIFGIVEAVGVRAFALAFVDGPTLDQAAGSRSTPVKFSGWVGYFVDLPLAFFGGIF